MRLVTNSLYQNLCNGIRFLIAKNTNFFGITMIYFATFRKSIISYDSTFVLIQAILFYNKTIRVDCRVKNFKYMWI